ncbi:MAG: hypothetical protein GY749_14610 [Desulfobacteraceae bacterium]|nr:hypothetical protein [Desulfobacteraceae bacterium]
MRYIDVEKEPEKSSDYYKKKGMRGPSADKVIKVAHDLFGDGLQLAHNCASRVVNSIKDMDDSIKPNEFELKLAIKLDTEAGVPVIVKMGTEAQMQVSMKWVHKE